MAPTLATELAAGCALIAAGSWAVGSHLFERILGPRHGGDPALRPSAAAANLFKNSLAAAIFLALWLVLRSELPEAEAWAGLLASGFLGFALGDALYFGAIHRTGVQLAAVLVLLHVPLAAILSFVLLGEALSLETMIAMSVTVAGVVLVLFDPPRGAAPGFATRDPEHRRFGVGLILIATVCYSLAVVAGHHALAGIDAVAGTVVRLAGGVTGALMLAPLVGLLSAERRPLGELTSIVRPLHTAATWKALAFASLFGSIIGLVFYHLALRDLPGGISAVLFSTTPLFTLPIGYFFGERHGWRAVVGTLVGFGGVAGVVLTLPQSPSTVESSAGTELELEELDVAAKAGSLAPELSVGPDGSVRLSWIEPLADESGAGHALRLSILEGDGWSEPETITSGSGWFVNWADFPRLAAHDDGTLLATWLVKSGPSTYAYDVYSTRRTAGSASWTDPAKLHDDATQTEHGFVSLLGGDGFCAVWLDGRATGEGGAMSLRTRTLDADGTPGAELLLDDRVCDCCQTAAAKLPDGRVVVAYRDRGPEEQRDISYVLGRPGAKSWSRPKSVHADGWTIAGCPVNGPVLAVSGELVAVAWFTLGDDATPRVQVAFANGTPLRFGAPLRIDDGQPAGRVDACFLEPELLLVSWLEETEDAAQWRARLVPLTGTPGASQVLAEVALERGSGFAHLVRVARTQGEDGGAEAIFAWKGEEEQGIRTQRISRRASGSR